VKWTALITLLTCLQLFFENLFSTQIYEEIYFVSKKDAQYTDDGTPKLHSRLKFRKDYHKEKSHKGKLF